MMKNWLFALSGLSARAIATVPRRCGRSLNSAFRSGRSDPPWPVAVGSPVCPHDCPSTCALEIDLLPEGRIGRVRGAPGNSYTAGVICAKVARYAERANHPDRLLHPLLRTGQIGRAHV